MEVGNNGYGKIYETTHWGQGHQPTDAETTPNNIGFGKRIYLYLQSLFN